MFETAVILAAGRSTRISPRFADRPKPLIPLGGRSVLEWNIDQVARAGITNIWINLHHQGAQIEQLIGDGERYGVSAHYLPEPVLLGTAGTVKHLANVLNGGPFLVVYGDNLTAFDLPDMLAFHQRQAAQMTLAIFDPLRVANTGMAGGRLTIAADGLITRFEEWEGASGQFVNAGLYAVEPEILDSIPDETPCDFGRDVFPSVLSSGKRLFGYSIDGCCLAVDTPEALERAEVLVEQLSERLIQGPLLRA